MIKNFTIEVFLCHFYIRRRLGHSEEVAASTVDILFTTDEIKPVYAISMLIDNFFRGRKIRKETSHPFYLVRSFAR